jgi:hypothetical protein
MIIGGSVAQVALAEGKSAESSPIEINYASKRYGEAGMAATMPAAIIRLCGHVDYRKIQGQHELQHTRKLDRENSRHRKADGFGKATDASTVDEGGHAERGNDFQPDAATPRTAAKTTVRMQLRSILMLHRSANTSVRAAVNPPSPNNTTTHKRTPLMRSHGTQSRKSMSKRAKFDDHRGRGTAICPVAERNVWRHLMYVPWVSWESGMRCDGSHSP